MINKDGQIEVPVGCSFNDGKTSYCAISDGDKSYRAIRPNSCDLCCFKDIPKICVSLACIEEERSDNLGVHFIKEGGEK